MKNIRSAIFNGTVALSISALLFGCNKDLPEATPIAPPPVSGQSIAQIISTSPEYTFLNAAILRAGSGLNFNPALVPGSYTVFAPTNDAFMASGIPSIAVINSLPAAQVAAIVNYHVMGGVVLNATSVPTTFPNFYGQSALAIGTLPAPLAGSVRMPIFPSRRGTSAWVNNIPIVKADIVASNGVIHNPAFLVMPPAQTIWNNVDTNSNFRYLKAAVQRADSGLAVSNAASLQGALNNALANLTVFAPVDPAFQGLLTLAITRALIARGVDPATAATQAAALASTPDVFKNPALFPVLTAQLVRGIVSYHVLGARAFAANLPSGDSNYPTIAGTALPNVQIRVASPSVQVRGPGNLLPGTTTPFYANVVIRDLHFINGTTHAVDNVLLPLPL